jgi:peptidoglycan hydrolase-like protein with peptidoglycan-binding domain
MSTAKTKKGAAVTKAKPVAKKAGKAATPAKPVKAVVKKAPPRLAVKAKPPVKPAAKPTGGSDPAVKKRQLELIAAGAKITADGVTGPGTRRAEAEFGHLVPKK